MKSGSIILGIMCCLTLPARPQCPIAKLTAKDALRRLKAEYSTGPLHTLKQTKPPAIRCNLRLGTLELQQWLSTPKRWSRYGLHYAVELAVPIRASTGAVLPSAIWDQRRDRLWTLKTTINVMERDRETKKVLRRIRKGRGRYHFGGSAPDCLSVAAQSSKSQSGEGIKRGMARESLRYCGGSGLVAYTLVGPRLTINRDIKQVVSKLKATHPKATVQWVTARRVSPANWSVVGSVGGTANTRQVFFSGDRSAGSPWDIRLTYTRP